MSAQSRKPGGKKKKRTSPGKEPGLAAATHVYCLRFQSDYTCDNCGDCCSTAWKIPLERIPLNLIRRAFKKGDLTPPDSRSPQNEDWMENIQGATGEIERYLTIKNGRDCCFLKRDGKTACAIQSQAGVEAMPTICRLFPRMCVLQPLGVFLTLSHYCPTVAEMLFRDDMTDGSDLEIVHNPPAFPRTAGYGGLDARNHLPPLLRPNVMMTWEAAGMWERHTLKTMARRDYTPEEALTLLMTTAEKARLANGADASGNGPFAEILEKDERNDPETLKSQIASLPSGLPHARQLYDRLLTLGDPEIPGMESVLETYRARYASGGVAAATERFTTEYDRFVKPRWREFETPLRRYLSTKLFANYHLYQGDGLRSGLFAVAGALAALRVHTAILCAREESELDREIITLAFRYTDLLLIHSLPRGRLARFFSLAETGALLDVLGAVPE